MNYNDDYDSFEDFESVSNKKEKEKDKIVESEPNTYYNQEAK